MSIIYIPGSVVKSYDTGAFDPSLESVCCIILGT